MPEAPDLWSALLASGAAVASEEEYEHGYEREVRGDLRKYLAFGVGDEMYGLPIEVIEEIIKPLPTTPVPRTAAFVLGIANVRGNVMPVIDLAARLKLRAGERERSARVLVVRSDGERYGVLVDSVHDVRAIAPESLEEAPTTIGGKGDFVAALARVSGQLLIVLRLPVVVEPSSFLRLAPGGAG
jgi:purine-binding chemotaxis protein CheW